MNKTTGLFRDAVLAVLALSLLAGRAAAQTAPSRPCLDAADVAALGSWFGGGQEARKAEVQEKVDSLIGLPQGFHAVFQKYALQSPDSAVELEREPDEKGDTAYAHMDVAGPGGVRVGHVTLASPSCSLYTWGGEVRDKGTLWRRLLLVTEAVRRSREEGGDGYELLASGQTRDGRLLVATRSGDGFKGLKLFSADLKGAQLAVEQWRGLKLSRPAYADEYYTDAEGVVGGAPAKASVFVTDGWFMMLGKEDLLDVTGFRLYPGR